MLPGWGQYYRGRKRAGLLYGGATLAAVAAVGHSYLRYRDAVEDYEALTQSDRDSDPAAFSRQFAVVASRSDRTNVFLWVLAGIWTASQVDNVLVAPDRVALRLAFGRK